jgi:hypothetical protein
MQGSIMMKRGKRIERGDFFMFRFFLQPIRMSRYQVVGIRAAGHQTKNAF